MRQSPPSPWHDWMVTPVGRVLVRCSTEGRLTGLWFDGEQHAPVNDLGRRDARPFAEVREQLSEYFTGRRRAFTIVTEVVGTPFQRAVWAQLTRTAFGDTTTYGRLAAQLGRPGAARAVGQASARNPLGILVPCHRVLGTAGGLTGYGGGISAKRWLVEHERSQCDPGLFDTSHLRPGNAPAPSTVRR